MYQTLEIISAMCRQEELNYTVQTTLSQLEQEEMHCNTTTTAVNADCRSMMVSWCYSVVDYCNFRRETVEIAMNYLDRYLTTPAGRTAFLDRSVYQLAAMACLYTAVKIHEPSAMDPKLVSNLSRGVYTPQQIEDMEVNILVALQWRVNPPTALAFVCQFLSLIPSNILNEEVRQTVYDLTKYQTELAVNEYDFVTYRASTIAFCALINSLESLGSCTTNLMNPQTLEQIEIGLSLSIGADGLNNNDSFIEVQNGLYELVLRQPSGTILVLQPPCKHHLNSSCVKHSTTSSDAASFVETSPRSISKVN